MVKRIVLSIIGIFFLLIISLGTAIFFRPQWFINPENLAWVLTKTKILKSWSWKEAKMEHRWVKWNHRGFSGKFSELCFEYESDPADVSSCIEEISWDVELLWLKLKTLSPFVIDSKRFELSLKDSPKKEEKSGPPDIWGYWQMLWSDLVPDMDFHFKKIVVKNKGKTQEFELTLKKSPSQMTIHLPPLKLYANSRKFEISLPPKYPFPKQFEGIDQLYLRNVILTGTVSEKKIPLELKGALEAIQIRVEARLDLPVKDEFTSVNFQKKFLLTVKGNVNMPGVRKNISYYVPKPFTELPAPLNVMDGEINLDLWVGETKNGQEVEFHTMTKTRLRSEKQALVFDLAADVPLNLKTYAPGEIGVGLQFHEVLLQLPRLSKKSPPPQFIPDSRIKKGPYIPESEKAKKKSVDLSLILKALNDRAMSFKTDLLDEILRLNFQLKIAESGLESGFIKILPLKTKVFKRPIHLKNLIVSFDDPEEPVIEAQLKFPLPEYLVTLDLEGPIKDPRFVFSSEPPLPQNDIYAVLLFGRPLADLDADDKTAAQKTNQLLSKGILSLSVLYFLAGSPVEYVGYDPDSKNATAQFGLGNKTSLRVGGGQEGVNSSAIRRSLGKGWYLDTSVQSPNTQAKGGQSRDYGVLLERIIAY